MEQQGIMRQLPTDDQTIVDYLYRIAGEYGEKAAVLMGDAALFCFMLPFRGSGPMKRETTPHKLNCQLSTRVLVTQQRQGKLSCRIRQLMAAIK
ncbi:hypothetical protein O5817_27265, partial [Escherichia coli]|nr:hypothetical protein [Escherichia coli]